MSKNMGENSKLFCDGIFVHLPCFVLLMIVRIFLNFFHLQSGPSKLGERRKVGSV